MAFFNKQEKTVEKKITKEEQKEYINSSVLNSSFTNIVSNYTKEPRESRKNTKDYKPDIEAENITIRYSQHIHRIDDDSKKSFLLDAIRIEDFDISGIINTRSEIAKTTISSTNGNIRSEKSDDIRIEEDGAYWINGRQNKISEEELNLVRSFNAFLERNGLFEPLKNPSFDISTTSAQKIKSIFNNFITEDLMPYIDENFNKKITQLENSTEVNASHLSTLTHGSLDFDTFLRETEQKPEIQKMFFDTRIDLEIANLNNSIESYNRMSTTSQFDYRNIDKNSLAIYALGALHNGPEYWDPNLNKYIQGIVGWKDNPEIALKAYVSNHTTFNMRTDTVHIDTFFEARRKARDGLKSLDETTRQHNESQVKDLEIRKTYFEKIQEISRTPETINGVEYPSKLNILAQSYDSESFMPVLLNPSSKSFDIISKTMYRLEKSTEELSLNKEYKEYQELLKRTEELQKLQQELKENDKATEDDREKCSKMEDKLEEDKIKLAEKLGIQLVDNKVTLEQIEKAIQETDNGAQIRQNAAAYLILADIVDTHPYNPAILASRDASRQLHDIANSSLLTFQESREFNALGVSKEYDTVGKCFEAVYGDKTKEKDLEAQLRIATDRLIRTGINLGLDPEQLSKLALDGRTDEVALELRKINPEFKNFIDEIKKIETDIALAKGEIKNGQAQKVSEAEKELQIAEKERNDYLNNVLLSEYSLEKIQELSANIKAAEENLKKVQKEIEVEATSDKIKELEAKKAKLQEDMKAASSLDSGDNERIINDYKAAVFNMAAYREAQNVVKNHKVIFSIEDKSTYEKNYPSQETIYKLKQCGLISIDKSPNGIMLTPEEKAENIRMQALRLCNPQEVAKRIVELQEDTQKKTEELETARANINNPAFKGKAGVMDQIKQLKADLNRNAAQLAVLEPAFEKYMDMHNLSASVADGKTITPEQKFADKIVTAAQDKMEEINIRNETILKNGELIFDREELETLKSAYLSESTRYSIDKEQLEKLSKIPGVENLSFEETSRVLSVYASNEQEFSHKVSKEKLQIIEESIKDRDTGRLDLALALATNPNISNDAAKEIDRNFYSLNEEYRNLESKQKNILQMEEDLKNQEKQSQKDIEKLEKLKAEFEKEKQELAEKLGINTSSEKAAEKVTLEKINDTLQERTNLVIYTAEHETQSKFFERMAAGEISPKELSENKKLLENTSSTQNQFNQFRRELIMAGIKNPEVHNAQLSEEELKAFRERVSQITDEAIDINAKGIESAVRNNFSRQIMQAYAYGNAYENPTEVEALKGLRNAATETMLGYQKNRGNVIMSERTQEEIHKKYKELHDILKESQISPHLHDKIMLSTLGSDTKTSEELSHILSSTKLSDGTTLGEKVSEITALRNTVISSTQFDKQAVEEIKSFAQTDVVKNSIILVENPRMSDIAKQEVDRIISDSFYDPATPGMKRNMDELIKLQSEVKSLQAMRERYVEIDEGLKAFANNSEITNGALALTESSYAKRIEVIDNRLKEIQEQCETISRKFSPLNISKEEANAYAETQAQAAIITDRLSQETGRVSSNIINQNMEPINVRRIQVQTQADAYHSLVKLMQLDGFKTEELDNMVLRLRQEQMANGTDDRYQAFIEALSQRNKTADISTKASVDEVVNKSAEIDPQYKKEIASEIKLILAESSPTFTMDFSQTQSFLKNPTENNEAKYDLFVEGIKDKEAFIRELASAGIFDKGFSNEIKTRDDMLHACFPVDFSKESQLRKIYDGLNSGNTKIDSKDDLQKESIEAAIYYNKLAIAMNEGRVAGNPSINSVAELPEAIEMIPISKRILEYAKTHELLTESEADKMSKALSDLDKTPEPEYQEASKENTELDVRDL